jgi:hypothetical protein
VESVALPKVWESIVPDAKRPRFALKKEAGRGRRVYFISKDAKRERFANDFKGKAGSFTYAENDICKHSYGTWRNLL